MPRATRQVRCQLFKRLAETLAATIRQLQNDLLDAKSHIASLAESVAAKDKTLHTLKGDKEQLTHQARQPHYHPYR